jgi:hypothetical protein
MGDLEAAEMSLQRSQRILQDLDSEYEIAKVTILMAELAMAQNEKVDFDSLNAALKTFKRLGAKYDQHRIERTIQTGLM